MCRVLTVKSLQWKPDTTLNYQIKFSFKIISFVRKLNIKEIKSSESLYDL